MSIPRAAAGCRSTTSRTYATPSRDSIRSTSRTTRPVSAPALDAALAIQRALREKSWPQNAEVLVRIGMHTGRPTLTDTGYVGIAVHIAARVCWASHGGQILLSSAAHDSFTERLAEGIAFRRLGRFSLHGVAEPEALWQVNVADLRAK